MVKSKAFSILRQESGFTLMEVVVTTILISYLFVALSEMIVGVLMLNRVARNYLSATEYTQHRMEYYRNAGYNAIPASEDFTSTLPPELGAPRSGMMTFTDLSPAVSGLKQMDITISYKDGATRSIKLTSLVAQRGIDR